MPSIDSVQNQTFKKLLSLTSSRGLKKEGLFLLSGEKLVREFLASPNLRIVHEVIHQGLKPVSGLSQNSILVLGKDLFSEIDIIGTGFNILVCEQPKIPAIKAEELSSYNPNGIEVVIPTGDPGNLGGLVRSCEAFGVPRVILAAEAAHPFLPKSVKASAGSVLRLPMARGPSLKAFPSTCLALDMNGTSLRKFRWPRNGLLVVGEEGGGLGTEGKKHFTHCLSIPTTGVESLNAVVAASIALAHKAGAVQV